MTLVAARNGGTNAPRPTGSVTVHDVAEDQVSARASIEWAFLVLHIKHPSERAVRERGSAGGRTSQLTTIRPPGSWIPPGGPVASHVQLFAWGEALLMFVGELQVPLQ